MKELLKTAGLGVGALSLLLGGGLIGLAIGVAWVGALVFWSIWLYGAFAKLFVGGF